MKKDFFCCTETGQGLILNNLFVIPMTNKFKGGNPVLKIWFIALRPWSFTASVIPICLGAVLAWQEGIFYPGLFLLTLIGGMAMHAGTNLINTYGDFMSGVDTEESASTCPQLVQEILKPKDMQRMGIIFFIFTFCLGLYLVKLRGPLLFFIGILGIIGGYGYTDGIAYKYKGIGVFCVFLLMGPMMVWGAYFVQTGVHSWMPVLVSLPLSFLVSAIMHANDFRDIEHDRQAGIKTLAMWLGSKKSYKFYCLLNIGAVLSLILLVFFQLLPPFALLPLLLLPKIRFLLIKAYQAGKGDQQQLKGLEAASAKMHFKFGSMMIVGVLLTMLLNYL